MDSFGVINKHKIFFLSSNIKCCMYIYSFIHIFILTHINIDIDIWRPQNKYHAIQKAYTVYLCKKSYKYFRVLLGKLYRVTLWLLKIPNFPCMWLAKQ